MKFILSLFYFLGLLLFPQTYSYPQEQDSIKYYRELSKNYKGKEEKKVDFAKKSLDLAITRGIDSTILLSQTQLASAYFDLGNYKDYVELTKKNIPLALKLSDSLVYANSNYNLGSYYYFTFQNDSAYYYLSKALKAYNEQNDIFRQAVILSNISTIQSSENDFAGSEENIIKANRLFDRLPQTDKILNYKWDLYRNFGSISMKLGSYNKSLKYHQKSLDVAKAIEEKSLKKFFSLNNIAYAQRELGEFVKSKAIYLDLINKKKEFNQEDPTFYPLLLNNLAFTKFKAGDTDFGTIEELLYKSKRISDSIEDDITGLNVRIDLAKYYLARKYPDSAKIYAEAAYGLSKKLEQNEIRLEVLEILSDLTPGDKGKSYLREHIRLSDSLLDVERNVRNKFARIEFETDQIEAENQKMSQQRMWLLITSIGLLLTLFLLYIIITQRSKNRELQFKQDQQKANEEIYNLMLSQQDKVDEARSNEKRRVSQELHDGVLGRLFGTRLSLDSLNFSQDKEAIKTRASYISELKIIEEDIRKISHDLSTDFVSGSGFMDIVSELIEKQTQAYQINYAFNYTDDINWEFVSNKNKINIYRIVQEALQNIYKHANASMVDIGITLKNDVICLAIKDDGDGFDVHKSKKGIGIKNINARVKELDGSVSYDSQLKKGTEVLIQVPYNDD